ncbi:MAG: putative membrane protein required for colicin V production [Rickettsiales bacterium]|jgi:uncharacterized membrane protein required for colicin V production
MNISTLIFLAIVSLFAIRGYKRGLLLTTVKYGSYLAAYAISIIFTIGFSKLLAEYLSIEGLKVYFISALIIFFGSSLVINLLIKIILEKYLTSKLGENIGTKSQIAGLILSLSVGCFIGFIAVYLFSFSKKISNFKEGEISNSNQHLIEDAKDSLVKESGFEDKFIKNDIPSYEYKSPRYEAAKIKKNKEFTNTPEILVVESKELPFINYVANKVADKSIDQILDLTLDNDAGKILARNLSKNPLDLITKFKLFINNNDVKNALYDTQIKYLLKKGDVKGLLENSKFNLLLNNKNIQYLVSYSGNTNNKKDLTKLFISFWQRADSIANNPRVIEIISDAEFIERTRNANSLDLLNDPKIKELADIISK